jgi:hypothetical protein
MIFDVILVGPCRCSIFRIFNPFFIIPFHPFLKQRLRRCRLAEENVNLADGFALCSHSFIIEGAKAIKSSFQLLSVDFIQ